MSMCYGVAEGYGVYLNRLEHYLYTFCKKLVSCMSATHD